MLVLQKKRLHLGLFRRKLKLSVDFENATWNTVAAHEVFIVTGMVDAFVMAYIKESLTSGGGATFAFGHEATTTYFTANIAVASLVANRVIVSGGLTQGAVHLLAHPSQAHHSIFHGVDLGYTIGTAAMTNGTIEFYAYWNPLSPGAKIELGAGGPL
ncbi:MAG: hypothetical protein ACRD1X_12375 [Vicinamibacteria bacterium]